MERKKPREARAREKSRFSHCSVVSRIPRYAHITIINGATALRGREKTQRMNENIQRVRERLERHGIRINALYRHTRGCARLTGPLTSKCVGDYVISYAAARQESERVAVRLSGAKK